ncbi:unnamed protein product [Soboliphyme baturini]|uniref:Dehydrogenase/reductase SDR family member 1 n=1 Tax=Soboliphyme baturini TaxID=241478 RepID=A0A183IGT8_9BILA|nr:unnamed protein product [Soboliphyme baturini]
MLKGKIALVTGASRGIGRGIALQLGEAGATVYITGRPPEKSDNRENSKDLHTLEDTAKEVTARGGQCIPVYCDHSLDDNIRDLFKRIQAEQNGKLDILVNNAFSAVKILVECAGKNFWEVEPDIWDKVNQVGLRNHYICMVYAARMMTQRKSGLIIFISSIGSVRHLFSVSYGVGKAAVDRMMRDCAEELQPFNVTCVSLWPGLVNTEIFQQNAENLDASILRDVREGYESLFKFAESTEFSGKAVVSLATDPNIFRKTGQTLMTADLGDEYGFTDVDACDIVKLLASEYLDAG